MIVLSVLILFLFLVVVIAGLWSIISCIIKIIEKYKDKIDYPSESICLTFKGFYALYQVNPERWQLGDWYPLYFKKCNESYRIFKEGQPIKFNKIDGKKYRKFVKQQAARKLQEQEITRTQEFINIVKQDIKAFEEKNKKETQEKLEKLYGGMKKL